MLNLPTAPSSQNERVLGQVYRESFTGLTTTTVRLGYTVGATLDGVSLETVVLNGVVVDPAHGVVVRAWMRDRFSGTTSATQTLSFGTWIDSPFVFVNGTLKDPNTEYSLSGTTLTLNVAPVNTDIIDVRYQYTTTVTYSLAAQTITFSRALVSADVVSVTYPYRT